MADVEKVMVSGIEVKGIKLPGRKGLVPALWPHRAEEGSELKMLVPVYWCQVCELEPTISEGQIAVSAGHDSHLHDESAMKTLFEISQAIVS